MKSEVIENIKIAPRIMKISLAAPEIAQTARPGQFVHLLCADDGSSDPLLRRPLSIHNVRRESGTLVLLYEVKGKGTDMLSRREPGCTVDLLGPLGNGFTLPASDKHSALVVGGGMGLAPLVFLSEVLVKIVGCENLTVHMGSRNQDTLICREDFELTDAEVLAATEDGSYGETGYVTSLVKDYLKNIDKAVPHTVYACGPFPMLAAVSKIVCEAGIQCQVSLESKMACGIGACMGCVVRAKSGGCEKYVRVCKEGPVFDACEVIW